MLLEIDRTIELSVEAGGLSSRPCIDVLFETSSEVYGRALAGVIMTGANQDGAAGLKPVAEAGGLALIESPISAYPPMMPRAGLDACPIAKTMSREAIASRLTSLGRA